MRFGALLCLAVLAAAGVTGIRPANADIIIGSPTPDNGNSYPFGNGGYTGEYEQVYDSGAFSGPITIYGVAFASNGFSGNSVGPISNTFSLSLSNTAADISNPSATYADNYGTNLTTVFNGVVTATLLQDGSFDYVVPFATPFTYDPSMAGEANLLMDVFEVSSDGATNYFEAGGGNPISRIYGNTPDIGYGLVTDFITSPVVSDRVPEPSQTAAFGLGIVSIAGLAAISRKRRPVKS